MTNLKYNFIYHTHRKNDNLLHFNNIFRGDQDELSILMFREFVCDERNNRQTVIRASQKVLLGYPSKERA